MTEDSLRPDDQVGWVREIAPHYRSGQDDLGADFFTPCLRHCLSYARASGFFSSTILKDWTSILPLLHDGPGISIRLLIAPVLSPDDLSALELAVDDEARNRLRQVKADAFFDELFTFEHGTQTWPHHVLLFAWLVACDHLQIRFAFPQHVGGAQLFHEKYGVFCFPEDDAVAFIGSANETSYGHHKNYESIDVYRSWIAGEEQRVSNKQAQFNDAWDGREPSLAIITPGPEVLRRIRLMAPDRRPEAPPPEALLPPGQSPVWAHQAEAIESFLSAKAGVLEMATGTGKTRVALEIVERLLRAERINSVLIATDGNDLLEQWHGELAPRMVPNGMPIYRHYGGYHEVGRYLAHPGNSALLVSRSALERAIRGLGPDQRRRTMIVHDEVHGLGSAGNISSLTGAHAGYTYRLGLSATPDREYDDIGTSFIQTEIGPVLYSFDLASAISRGVLCEFEYRPIAYDLTTDDRERLKHVYAVRSARQHSGRPMSDQELYRMLSDVYKTAEEKPGLLAQLVRKEPALLDNTIIFAHTKEYAASVVEVIHSITPRYSTYFDDDNADKLQAFARGDLDCLLTCHRLSQGIDIRSLKHVILLSADRVKLETIQRIGRCLRTDPRQPGKKAVVIDFVRRADDSVAIDADRDRSEWLSQVAATRREY